MFKILQEIILQQQTNKLFVAYSGGIDSHVLLHAVKLLQVQGLAIEVQAVHVNHHLSAQADAWAQHCQQICADLHVPLIQLNVQLEKNSDESLEAQARDARYAAFVNALPAGSVILTAHHQDDQAETLLLQLLRGAGPKGLQAMPVSRQHEHLTLLRPFLGVTKKALLAFAQEHHLHWVEDDSNNDVNLQRNLLRKEVMPQLQKHWPKAKATIARSAEYFVQAHQCTQDLAALDYKHCHDKQNTLVIGALLKLPHYRQKQVVRYWLLQQGFNLPSAVKLEQIFTEVIAAKEDAMPCVHWQGVEVRRYRDRLYANKPLSAFDATQALTWDWRQPLTLPVAMGTLVATQKQGQGISLNEIAGLLEVRFRQGGEKCYLPGRLGGHSLKNLFQEWGVPTWQRDRTPLLYYKNQLVAVVGYCICAGFSAKADEAALAISLMRS